MTDPKDEKQTESFECAGCGYTILLEGKASAHLCKCGAKWCKLEDGEQCGCYFKLVQLGYEVNQCCPKCDKRSAGEQVARAALEAMNKIEFHWFSQPQQDSVADCINAIVSAAHAMKSTL